MKNQKGFVVPLVIAIVALLAIGGGTYVYVKNNKEKVDKVEEIENQDQTADWKTYTNGKYGFEFKYPKNLIELDRTLMTEIGQLFYLDLSDISIDIWNTKTYTYEQLMQPPPGGIDEKTIKQESISVNNSPAVKYSYTYVGDDNLGVKPAQKIFIKKNGLVYIFECHEQKCDQILSTFKFITPTQGQTEQNKETDKVACTMDAKICPDGSFVGRSGPNCEFTPCSINTTTWKTYVNEKYVGYTIKYPSSFEIKKLEQTGDTVVTFDDGYPDGMRLVLQNYYGDIENISKGLWDSPNSLKSGVKNTKINTKINGYNALIINDSDISPYGKFGYIQIDQNNILMYGIDFTDGSKYPIEDQVKIYEKMLESLKFFAL